MRKSALSKEVKSHIEVFLRLVWYTILGMRIGQKTKETLTDVSTAANKVTSTTEIATVALVAVCVVSLLALGVGMAALTRASEASRARG